jgi:hypothetical protein
MEQFGSTFKAKQPLSHEDKEIFSIINPIQIKYGAFDFVVLAFIFFLGFFINYIVNFFRKKQTQKLEEILQKFQGHKNEYERCLKRTEWYKLMRLRVKFVEKVLMVIFVLIAFFLYKNPNYMQRVVFDNAFVFITSIASFVLVFNYSVWYLDKQHKI